MAPRKTAVISRRGTGSTPMATVMHDRSEPGERPKPRVVAKDESHSYCQSLVPFENGEILVGHAPQRADPPAGSQLRSGRELSLVRTFDAGPPLALGTDGIFAGVRRGFDRKSYEYLYSVQLVRLDDGRLVDELPLRGPLVWLPSGELLAQTLEPEKGFDLSPKWPNLPSERGQLVAVDVRERKGRRFGPARPSFLSYRRLAVMTGSGAVAFVEGPSAGVLDVASGTMRWSCDLGPGNPSAPFSLYALAASPDERLLAVGGIAGEREEHGLVLLDAATGKIHRSLHLAKVLSMSKVASRAHTSIHALAWHPTRWLAVGTAGGTVLHVAPNGAVRVYKGSAKGIHALTFVEGGRTLLVGGYDAGLRAIPLLDDEVTHDGFGRS